jgi:CBS domain containing-hemolysin-like protein
MLTIFIILFLGFFFISTLHFYTSVNKDLSTSEKSFFFLQILTKNLKIKNLNFLITSTKYILQVLITSILLIFFTHYLNTILSVLLALSIMLIFELNFFYLSNFEKTIYISSLIAPVYIFLFLPITFLLLKTFKMFLKKKSFVFNEKFLDFEDLKNKLDPKILSSLATFKEKVVREVMIPRIKTFSFSKDKTIKEASTLVLKKNYSRIPVYKEKLDNIIGVLMHKDLLKAYIESEENKNILSEKIEKLIKPIIYVPENKKIFQLFQEFRSKKTHIAIVVNEYGGTEGIITIEDILEELVGEIQDEYDKREKEKIYQLSDGNWVIDAQMSIIDIEKKLNFKIPHSPEYETIGGFIFHRAKMIPDKGWILHLDEFEIEVLSSNERCVEKVKINPIKKVN